MPREADARVDAKQRPLLRDPSVQALLRDVEQLEAEHRAASACHDRTHELTERWLADGRLNEADARDLVSELGALRDLYREHIAFEENNVFPRAADVLSALQIAQVGEEMAARRGLSVRTSSPFES